MLSQENSRNFFRFLTKTKDYWTCFRFVTTIFDVWTNFLFFTKIIIFDHYFNFWKFFKFLTTIFDFWPQFSIFEQIFNFWTKSLIFDQRLYFWLKFLSLNKFKFLTKILIFEQILEFLIGPRFLYKIWALKCFCKRPIKAHGFGNLRASCFFFNYCQNGQKRILNVPLNIYLFNNWKNRMLADFNIPRPLNDMKIAVQNNNLRGHICSGSRDFFWTHFDFLAIFLFLKKKFFSKFWFLKKKIDFWTQFRFLKKSSIFEHNFDFWIGFGFYFPTFWFLNSVSKSHLKKQSCKR